MPATGHLNPLLGITRILLAEGHEVAFVTGSAFRSRIESSGAEFFGLPAGADFEPREILSAVPEFKSIPPGLEWLRLACERIFVDAILAQHQGLEQSLQRFPADVIVGDDMFFGVLPMLLGLRAERPPIVICGTSILHWTRQDGAPNFLGLPPAMTAEQRAEYAAKAREYDEVLDRPVVHRVNQALKTLGNGQLSMPLFHSVVELADAYMQLSVPGFEYPREMPSSVYFVGTPPIIPGQVPLPPWADDLDGSRKVVFVTQGTMANHNFDLLVTPTLAALANEPDVLVVATAGGRPIEAIPGHIPSNARVASFLPFEWLLPRVSVLVTNGGYGSVNQAMSFGIPLVAAGLTEDKADVNARVAWSGVGINLATNEPTQEALRQAVRTVLDRPAYRLRASQTAKEFAGIDTRSEIIRIINQVVTDEKLTFEARTMGHSHPACRPSVSQSAVGSEGEVTLLLRIPLSSRKSESLSKVGTMQIQPTSFAFTLLLGFLAAVPYSGIDINLPALAATGASLGKSASDVGLTMSAFMFSLAVAPLLYGPVSDRLAAGPSLCLASRCLSSRAWPVRSRSRCWHS
jgi:MGT family glycosyltransferase